MGSSKLTVAVPPAGRDGTTDASTATDARPGVLGRAFGLAQDLAHLTLAVIVCLIVVSLVPILFGWRSYVVLSGSMSPGIHVGDVAIAAPARRKDLRPGQIAVFPDPGQPGRLLVHRIQVVRPDGTLITKGDANAAADSTPVPIREIRGVMRLRVPVIALPAYWWQTRAWLPLVATGLLLAMLLVLAYPPEPASDGDSPPEADTADESGQGMPDESGRETPDESGRETPDESGQGTPDESGRETPAVAAWTSQRQGRTGRRKGSTSPLRRQKRRCRRTNHGVSRRR